MKGRRLILFACVIMLSFAGVGYSAWTEGLSMKSFFATGSIHVVFEAPKIENNELYEINVDDASDGVLIIIDGTVPPETRNVVVEYGIYNGSSIPVKYDPAESDLPEGIILDQLDTVIEPGEYLLGNHLTIEPGENELILPFVQYNSNDSGGWKEELKVCWNIKFKTVDPVMDLISESAITEGAPIEDIPETESPDTATTPEVEPINHDHTNNQTVESDVPETETPIIETPVTETTPVVDPLPEEPPVVEAPSEDPTETNDENLIEDNTESDEGSEDNGNS